MIVWNFSSILYLLGTLVVSSQGAPSFSKLPSSVAIDEKLAQGQNVFEIESSSGTTGPSTYTVVCVDASSTPPRACNVFGLTPIEVTNSVWKGYVTLTQRLDAIANARYVLSLRATDSSGQSSTSTLQVDVKAVRLRPPRFTSKLDEEIAQRPTASQEEIIRYVAEDPTQGNRVVNYRILNGPFKNYFALDQILGRLTNTKPLQYSDPIISNSLPRLSIQAAYVINGSPAWDDPSASTTINSTIFLTDQNLNKPMFDSTSYAGSIQENALIDTYVNSVIFVVEDRDRSRSSASFSLSLSNYNEIFKVVPDAGYGRLEARLAIKTNDFFNYNKGPRFYNFNVVARETSSKEQFTSTVPVNVSIIQVNRFTPQFKQNPYVASIPENAAPGASVVRVEAWDEDVGDFGNRSIWYRFSTGASDTFKMNTQSGLITVANCRNPGVSPCLDYEDTKLRNTRLIVWGADVRGEGKTGTTTVVVNIENVNDNAPKFDAGTYFANIEDGTTNLSPLNPPQLATDADGDPVTYSLVGSPLWKINPSSGQISPTRAIKYNDALPDGLFNLVVIGKDSLFEAKANVKIQVNPVNRFSPVFQRDVYNLSIPDTQKPDVAFITVQATDQDSPSQKEGQILYTILSGSQGKFGIDRDTGQVSVLPGQTLDYQTQPFYNITIEGRDQGTPSRSSRCILLVYLTPERPFIGLADSIEYVSDDKPVGSLVLKLQATTSQITNPDINYKLLSYVVFDRNLNQISNTSEDQQDLFEISPKGGEVTVKKTLNANRVRRWQGVVEVSANGLSNTGLLTIWISATNKIPPTFELPWTAQNPNYVMRVQQGKNFQKIAGSYTATPGNSSLSIRYELVDPNNRFKLDSPNSGIIIQESPLSQPTNNYVLKLTATDNGQPPLSTVANINVQTISSNLLPPVFEKSRYDVVMQENVPDGFKVVQVKATDTDPGNFGVVKYMLEPEAPRFNIDETSGQITVKNNSFNALSEPFIFVNVRAYDSPDDLTKSRTAFTLVNISVQDSNNNEPTFNPANYQSVINSNAAVGTEVLKVSATDADQGENAKITYAIVEGNDEAYFKIDKDNGLISVAKQLKEVKGTYNLVVEASDNGVPKLKGHSNVTIFVNVFQSTNCLPQWVEPATYLFEQSVPEEYQIGKSILDLRVSYIGTSPLQYIFDVDGTETIVSGPFSIVREKDYAKIVLNSRLDYNAKREYELVTSAKGCDDTKVSRFIVIRLIPNRKYNPRFGFDNFNCAVPIELVTYKGVVPNSLIGKIKATPNYVTDIVEYKIEGNNEIFRIDNTGEIYTKMNLENNAYSFHVEANYITDFEQRVDLCQNKTDQSKVRVDVTVQPYSIFIPDNITICLKDDTLPGTVVSRLDTSLNNTSVSTSYTQTSNKAFNITKDGRVILLDLTEAKKSECWGNADCVPIKVHVQQMFKDYTIASNTFLKMKIVPQDQPLTLITLESDLNEYNKGSARPTFLSNLAKHTTYQCIVDVGYHTTQTGNVDFTRTDVFLYTMERDGEIISPMQLDGMYRLVQSRKEAGIIGITDASSRLEGGNFEPVAIAMGLIIVLIFLACLLFLCFCCWGYCSQWCYKRLREKEPMISGNGLAEKVWTSQPVLDMQPEPVIPDVDILPTESYHSNRREDVTTVDGAASGVTPTGYVHIEAPLERSASAFAAIDEVDTRVETIQRGVDVESVQREVNVETIQRGLDAEELMARSKEYERDEVKARAYSSKSGGLDDIDAGDDQKPVQLNLSDNKGPSQVGAVLTRPETPRRQGYTQRIVGWEGAYDSSTLNFTDPSNLHMAYQNEMVMDEMPGQTVYYDETRVPEGTYQNQPLTYETVVNRYGETKYL